MSTIKEFTAERLSVRVFESRNEMGAVAAKEATECLVKLLQEKEAINVLFAAAPSQNEFLASLVENREIDWSRVNAFHMDEYIGLDSSHPAGFRNFLKRAIFDKLPFRSVHLLNGNNPDPDSEALRYAGLLAENTLDVVFMGIGENGHIAFNDPPVADFNDPVFVKVVELEERCRVQQVNDGCFAELNEVPTHALTVTIPCMMKAGHLFCMVPAATKANAVRDTVYGPITTACPASILRTHPAAKLYLDKDSGKYI